MSQQVTLIKTLNVKGVIWKVMQYQGPKAELCFLGGIEYFFKRFIYTCLHFTS